MDISIFDVIGPVMIGPSSSHTAGAARLARISALIVGKSFHKVSFGLHGSFAHTYKGHGTDRALLAGVMGIREDDERLADAYELARLFPMEFRFNKVELDNAHENTVMITFYCDDGTVQKITGSSIGGGQIIICRINEFETEFNAQFSTLLVSHYDHKGVISKISGILSDADVNIAVMKLTRRSKGDVAFCIIEADEKIDTSLIEHMQAIDHVISVRLVEKAE